MKVRGIVLQARKAIITRRFGAEAWAGLFRDIAAAHDCFRAPLSQASVVPLPAFLAFHDELMRRFYKDDDASYFQVGGEAASWTLGEGPYRKFMERRDLADLVTALPTLWKMFFVDTSSRAEASIESNTVRFKVFDLPESHRYFEPFVVGYNKEVLEMFCANPIRATRIRSSETGYQYLFHFAHPERDEHSEAPPSADRKLRARQSVSSLSDREADVLLLLAEGKTNQEIGVAMGISGKTVQHHITRAYRKIGASGRVGATIWLARKGLIDG